MFTSKIQAGIQPDLKDSMNTLHEVKLWYRTLAKWQRHYYLLKPDLLTPMNQIRPSLQESVQMIVKCSQ